MSLYVSAKLSIAAPSCFREKPIYVKVTTISTAQGTKNYIKAIVDLSTFKINMTSRQFPKFCLCQQLFAFKRFCMGARLSNILKTTNATNLVKTVLESTYKVALGTFKLLVPTRPAFLLREVEFQATFDIQIVLIFVIS